MSFSSSLLHSSVLPQQSAFLCIYLFSYYSAFFLSPLLAKTYDRRTSNFQLGENASKELCHPINISSFQSPSTSTVQKPIAWLGGMAKMDPNRWVADRRPPAPSAGVERRKEEIQSPKLRWSMPGPCIHNVASFLFSLNSRESSSRA